MGLGILSAVCAALVLGQSEELALWPEGLPPGAKAMDPARVEKLRAASDEEWIRYVDRPALVVYRPERSANGCAVVVCPGGGYNGLAWKKEGVEVAQWLNQLGITAFVLKYRVPRRDPDTPWFEPLQDLQRAIRSVRARAGHYGVDPHRVGVLGFSAGGHLAAMAAMHWRQPAYPPRDSVDKLPVRPDFCILIYAAYLGDRQDPTRLSSLVRVDNQTPPMFLTVTWNDQWRGLHAALLFAELKKAGVEAECHIFVRGDHGYALRPEPNGVSRAWPRLCALWLRNMGFLKAAKGGL